VTHRQDTTCAAFVPGFMQHGETWAPVLARVVGHYATTTVEFETPTLAASLEAIRAAGAGGVLVGYSMGGRLALRAALADSGAYRALVLVGATPGIEDEGLRRSRRAADDDLAAWMETARIDAVVDHWQAQPVFATQSPELVAQQRRGRVAHDPRQLAAMLRATGQGALDPVWDDLPRLTMPVLAVAGEFDSKYADIALRMADALPHGRAALIPGAGHAAHMEQPDAFADLLLDFLDEHLG
jgi:2-succinyl-6-hydroxy-2,4-cyclohexadiene-1-carboxylate synthase